MSELGNRSRITLDNEDWVLINELVKLRFAELVELGQTDETNNGTGRQAHRDAAIELWQTIKDMELQMSRNHRKCEKCKRIVGPLRDWRAAAQRLGLAKLPESAPPAVLLEAAE